MSAQPEHMISTDIDSRVQLARSILNHRDWCEACRSSAAEVTAALDGKTIDEITGGN